MGLNWQDNPRQRIDEGELFECVKFIHVNRLEGKSVYVHCAVCLHCTALHFEVALTSCLFLPEDILAFY